MSRARARMARARRRRPAAVGRPRPAVPDRLRGDAARAADDAGRCPATATPSLVVPRLEAPRVDERPDLFAPRAVGGDRRPGRARGRRWPVAAPSPPSATARGPGSCVELQARMPGHRVPQGERGHRSAARGEGRRRDRRAAARGAAAVDRVAARAAGRRHPARRAAPRPRCRRTSRRRLVAEGHHRVNFAIVAAGDRTRPARTTTPATA